MRYLILLVLLAGCAAPARMQRFDSNDPCDRWDAPKDCATKGAAK